MFGSRFRVALLLVLTFTAGVAAGVAADRLELLPGLASATEATADGDRREDDRRRGETTIERFADDLGLTASQRAEIEEILEHYRQRMHQMWEEVRPRYRSMVDSVRGRIEGVLTPEQVTEYRELLRARGRWRQERQDDGDTEGKKR